jgi:hypothetical protein
VAPFSTINGNDITAIHRIALNADGSKIERRMLGVCRRVAIKLDPIAGDTVAIGEGLETCLAARELKAMGQLQRMPVWALGSVGAISFFPPLNEVKVLMILGEQGDASLQAQELCRRHWCKADKHVKFARPQPGFSDFNDILIAEITERTVS